MSADPRYTRRAMRRRGPAAAGPGAAREQLILRRKTHLDQLADKLREERVRRVVEPLLSGTEAGDAIAPDDLEYVRDLGLVTRSGPVAIANPIYREVIPRDLTWTTQEMSIHHDPAWYVGDDGACLHGPLRGGGRAPGGLRPHRGKALGREDLPPRRGRGRHAHHGVGDVTAGGCARLQFSSPGGMPPPRSFDLPRRDLSPRPSSVQFELVDTSYPR